MLFINLKSMLNLFFLLNFSFLISSCSSSKILNLENVSDREIDKALKNLDHSESKINYGPSTVSNSTYFVDKTEQYGLDGLRASSIMLADFNEDGYSDIVLIQDYFSQPEFYIFDKETSKFVKGPNLFDENFKASFIIFHDMDKDGIIDAVTGVLNQKSELSENSIRFFKGKRINGLIKFYEEKDSIGLPPSPTSSIGLIDYNLDGYLDLYIGNWFEQLKGHTVASRDYLLKYDGKKFEDISETLVTEVDRNPQDTMYINATPTHGVKICDVDNNGFPDILTTSTNGFRNKLWINRYKVRQKERYFQDISIESGFAGDSEGNLTTRGGGRSFGIACGDYNNNGITDIFIGESSHSYDSEMVDRSSVLTGASPSFPPKYIRTEYVLDADDLDWSQSDRRAIWFDYNNDGLLDLLVDNSGFPPHTRLLLFKQLPDHSFVNVSKEAGIDIVNPISSVILDVNQDGQMDILSAQSSLRDSQINQRLYLFENRGELNQSNTIRVYLRGEQSNFQGLNASVSIKVLKNQKITSRNQYVNYSYGGLNPQNEEGLHFAINNDEELVGISVVWPFNKDGTNLNRANFETYYDLSKVKLNQRTLITLCESGKFLINSKSCLN